MPQQAMISIVGRGGSGKTTLVERLIPELIRAGLSVGTIKHDVHGLETDKEGKDTWRHTRAGAEVAVLLGPTKMTVFRRLDQPKSLREAAMELNGVDLIIAEGFKQEPGAKIEVWRQDLPEPPACLEDPELLALVTDDAPEGVKVPVFSPGQIRELADMILKRFEGRGEGGRHPQP